MANSPAIACTIDVRSSGILMDYVHAHEPCAPGAAAYARRRMFQYNSLLSQRGDRGGDGQGRLTRNAQGPGGCCSSGVPYNGSGSIYAGRENWPTRYGDANYPGYSQYGPWSVRNPLSTASKEKNAPRQYLATLAVMGIPLEEEEDYTKFDRTRDWVTCFGAVVIVACVIGLIHSYAVFVPAIQHHYGTGMVETILLGCLSYFALLVTIPLAVCLNNFLEHRWTATFGMVLFFLGLLLDALTVHVATLYIAHILLMGCGGSCAYVAAMSIISNHFRRYLVYALGAVTCAGSIGTIIFYLLSNLMLSYVSYLWTKLCLALIVLICTGACQTFPKRSKNHLWRADRWKNEKLKACVKEAAKERDANNARLRSEEAPRKSCLCVCVCDISVWTDISFLLWATVSFIALITLFIPYLFLVAYAYTAGASYAIGLVCWFCVASILARLAVISSNDHTFGFNRTLFQICCIGSGILYICLNWAETYGWILVWGLAIGAIEGILCVVVPRVTLQCIPTKWLSSSWRCIGLIQAFSVIVGPMIMTSVYHHILEYGPALIAIGVAQIIAGILAFLLPNEEGNELEDLKHLQAKGKLDAQGKPIGDTDNYHRGPRGSYIYGDRAGYKPDGYAATGRDYSGASRLYGGSRSRPESFSTSPGLFESRDYGGSKTIRSSSYRRSTFDTESFLRGGSKLVDTYSRPYTDECPICSKVGGIPGCCSGCA